MKSWLICLALLALSLPASAQERELHAGDGPGSIQLLMEDRKLKESEVAWRAWIERLATSAASVAPGIADRPLIVRLQPARRRDSITYGRIRRTRPPEIHLQVHPEASMEGLLEDWRGFHEFAHLLIPFPGNDDIWFSEGLASYYQHFLQVRAGVIDPNEAWQRLFAGFRRGLRDPNGRDRTLSELSPEMWRERAFRRVYWTGAAYFLRVDLRLRTESAEGHSVDSALAAFNRCCADDQQGWDAIGLIEKFGELTDPDVWLEEYTRMINAPAIPEVEPAMSRLGVTWFDGGVRLSGDERDRQLRENIACGGDCASAIGQ